MLQGGDAMYLLFTLPKFQHYAARGDVMYPLFTLPKFQHYAARGRMLCIPYLHSLNSSTMLQGGGCYVSLIYTP